MFCGGENENLQKMKSILTHKKWNVVAVFPVKRMMMVPKNSLSQNH